MAVKDVSAEFLWNRQFHERMQTLVRRRTFVLPVASSLLLWLAWLDGDRTRFGLLLLVVAFEIAVAIYYMAVMRRRGISAGDVVPNIVAIALGGAVLIFSTGDLYSPFLPGLAIPAALLGGVLGQGSMRRVMIIPVIFISAMLAIAMLDLLPRFSPLLAARPMAFLLLRTGVIAFVVFQVWNVMAWMIDDAAKLMREVEVANEQLAAEMEASQRATGLMVSQLAHELRNPLAAIKGLHKLVQSAPAAANSAAHLEVISEEIVRLERTLDATLDFGKPAPGGPHAYFDLAAPMQSALRILQFKALRKDIAIQTMWPKSFTLKGDEQAWRQVFFNLLLNAVEALSEGGRIVIAAQGEGNEVVLSVRDNGPGIAPELLASVWEPYVSGKAGGTGLGLSIVRQVVSNHGGQVEVQSVAGEGTEIILRIPLRNAGE